MISGPVAVGCGHDSLRRSPCAVQQFDTVWQMPEITDHIPAPPRRLGLVVVVGALAMAAIIGFALTRNEPPGRTAGPIRVSGWAPYWQTDSSLASFKTNAAMFSDVSLFAWSTVAADNIRTETVDPRAIRSFATAAAQARVPFIATIFDGMQKGELAAVLADPSSRALHINTLVQFVVDGGFGGIDLDYEQFAFADGYDSWATTRPNWVAFITELAPRLHAEGKLLIVSAPPMYDKARTDESGYWVYDFEAIAPFIDSLRLMAYDFSTSEPGPIAPISWVAKVVSAARTMVPDKKIMLGVPVYGYSWVTGVTGTCPADQEPRRRNLSIRTATQLATEPGVVSTPQLQQSERTLAYTEVLNGFDAAGTAVSCSVSRLAWYPDQQGVFDRVALAERENLAGVALWALGYDSEQAWDAIVAAGTKTTLAPATSALPTASSVPPSASTSTMTPAG